MNTTFALVDYHNFHKNKIKNYPQPSRRSKMSQDTVDWVVDQITSTLTAFLKRVQRPPSVLEIRLYGGWHSGAIPTDDAKMVESALKKIPRRSTATPTRLVFELATSLLDLPHIPIFDTLRPRENYPRLTVRPHIENCQSSSNCALASVASVLKRGVCNAQGCGVTIAEATSVLEQKCVDILLATDLLSLSRDGDDAVLVTEDLDLIPAVLKAQHATTGNLTWICDALTRKSHYSSSLESLGVVIEPMIQLEA